MRRDEAEVIAINALTFLAGEERRLAAFMQSAGLTPEGLRQGLRSAEVQAGALDHLLGDERLLLFFCEETGLAPEAPARARRLLPGAPPEG